MKICVSAVSDNLDVQMVPRFGRYQYLLFVDSETMELYGLPNVASRTKGGAGVQATQQG